MEKLNRKTVLRGLAFIFVTAGLIGALIGCGGTQSANVSTDELPQGPCGQSVCSFRHGLGLDSRFLWKAPKDSADSYEITFCTTQFASSCAVNFQVTCDELTGACSGTDIATGAPLTVEAVDTDDFKAIQFTDGATFIDPAEFEALQQKFTIRGGDGIEVLGEVL